MQSIRIAACAASVLAAFASGAADRPEGDPARGARVFRACAVCHSLRPAEHMTGPSLGHVWGRKAGTAEGFRRYSDAMKRSAITWNARTLERWLADPDAFIHGTSMMFPGLRSAGDRGDVIAYLHAVSEGKAEPAPRSGGMMGGGGRANLREAPPEGRVTRLAHCGDTYTVTTADGRSTRVWEFNLRLKTDASRLGPPEGRPAIVGAGMRGDRASIVFAKPAEISPFVKEECGDGK